MMMNDTAPKMDRLFRNLMAERTPEERLRMACGMFETARALVRAGLRQLDGAELEKAVFLRLYEGDISPGLRDKVLTAIDERYGRGI